VPGTVNANAYRDTKVTALVGGVVRQVPAELGASVGRGQPLAVIFSNELAEAQMKFLSTRALLGADHQRLDRTRKLVDIGAASRQELDDATAAHAARATEVAAARQRLILLGLSAEQAAQLTEASQIVSEVQVVAPASGLVIARAVNAGQVVAAGQDLFVVADLGTVWVIGDLYEKDFAAVRVGTPATVRAPAAAERPIHGRVAYIDPRVDPATRTAKVRVEVPNRDAALRLGMFVDVTFQTGAGGARTTVPRAAVQAIGSRTVVYVATEDEGRFVERVVRLGAGGRDRVEVLEGLKPGERVAAEGSFYLRAEAGRARGG
jgi:RND family efflux transporter MFP subunit